MAKKNLIILFIIAVVVILVGVGAWFALNTTEEVVDVDEKADEEVAEVSEELVQVLAKAEDIHSVKYDVIIDSPEGAFTGHFWQKEGKFRMEMTVEDHEIVNLIDRDQEVAYSYIPAYNMATKMDLSQAEAIVEEGSVKEQSLSLLDYNPVVVGSEVIDDKNCLVVEYVANGEKVKMWIWKEHGLSLKTKVFTDPETIESWVENIEFVDIPDDMFELPADVQITETPAF